MATTPERLAVLETDVATIKEDVGEIKADVKALLRSDAARSGIVTFIRAIAPWAAIGLSIVSVALSVTGG